MSWRSILALGPDANYLEQLRPQDAWGDNSIYEWMEKTDAHLVSIGEPWDACSLKHRSEWLSKVSYRYLKEFEGEMIRNGKREPLKERLFVRSLDPLVQNNWSKVSELFKTVGMRSIPLGAAQLAHMNSKALIKVMLERLHEDPFAFVCEPDRVRAQFSIKEKSLG